MILIEIRLLSREDYEVKNILENYKVDGVTVTGLKVIKDIIALKKIS